MSNFFKFVLVFFAPTVLVAIPWNGPCNTPSATAIIDQAESKSKAPAPTIKPELVKRDDYPPEFCGWLGGSISYAPCDPFSTCVWRKDVSAVGCCRDTTNLNTCRMYTTCVDYVDLGASTLSTSDSLLLRCTDSVNPICGSIRFEPSFYNYLCTDTKTAWDVSLSSINQTTWRGGIPRYVVAISTTFTTNLTESSSTTSTSTASPFTIPASASHAQSSPSPAPSATSSSSHKKIVIGAAVGGTIAGIIVLCLMGCILKKCLGTPTGTTTGKRPSSDQSTSDLPGGGFIHVPPNGGVQA